MKNQDRNEAFLYITEWDASLSNLEIETPELSEQY